MRSLVLYILFFILLTACESVKPYQRMYLNDHEMKAGPSAAGKFEENVQVYREGSSGGGSSKTSGGCGCN